MKSFFKFSIFALFSLHLFACTSPPPVQENNNQVDNVEVKVDPSLVVDESSNETSSNVEAVQETESSAYPAPEAVSESYPAPAASADQGYPPPSSTVVPRANSGVFFSIDPGTKSGDTVVRGTAPPNLSIAIVNITLNGEVLGVGRSDADGNFEINLPVLEPDRRIGIALAELEEGVTFEEKAQELFPYRGEQFMSLPNVGVYFETMMIE